jgi:ankyrin repeat protein
MPDLHSAARGGDIAALNLAIAQKQNLNAQDSLRRTPLQLAAWSGQTEAVKLLLSAGVNVGLGATDGVTGGSTVWARTSRRPTSRLAVATTQRCTSPA